MNDPLVEPYSSIDSLLESGDYAGAKTKLDAARQASAPDSDVIELLEIKAAVLSKQIQPGMALTRIVAVMRRIPNHPFARALFQTISQMAYTGGQSSLSHSHPPPPPPDRD
ncbi:MAG TPA: hypothetical protein VHO25_02430 [Polyangiaceae bacterium]|nr:hypothetical protein [Polyangiaceae bacterium]